MHRPPRRSEWSKLLTAKANTGWFALATGEESNPAPLSGKPCAVWTLLYEGHGSAGEARFFTDEWPRGEVSLVVDGVAAQAPQTALRFELPPSVTREYAPGDAAAPPAVRRMFTEVQWVGSATPLPASVTGTEHCLAAKTSFRAELRQKSYTSQQLWGPTEEISRELAIAPAK